MRPPQPSLAPHLLPDAPAVLCGARLMAQVNVTYADDLVAALDRVAAARRMARPELLRAIALEAVEAYDTGWLAFRRENGPRLDASISGLVVQLRDALTEIARMQNDNIRFQKRLVEAFTGSEKTVGAALERVWAHIRALNVENFKPFVDELDGLIEHMEAAEERTQAAVAEELSAIHERLDAVLKAAGEAKVQHNLVLGDNRTLSFWFLLRMSWLVGALSVLLFLLFAQWSQPMALFVSTGLINTDERVCLLVNWKGGVEDCRLPSEMRERALARIAAEAEKPDKPEADKLEKPKGTRK